MKSAKFIVFEGIDGSGKSTQIELLSHHLKDNEVDIYCTMEPSERPIGRLIRKILKKEITTTHDVIAGLYMADRLDHLNNHEDGIIKKMGEGTSVISDRYYLSSLAYNSLTTSLKWVYELNARAMDLLQADVTFYLDLDVNESLHRINTGRSSSELFEKKEILEQVKSNYEQAIQMRSPHEKIIRIDANRDPELVHADICQYADSLYGI